MALANSAALSPPPARTLAGRRSEIAAAAILRRSRAAARPAAAAQLRALAWEQQLHRWRPQRARAHARLAPTRPAAKSVPGVFAIQPVAIVWSRPVGCTTHSSPDAFSHAILSRQSAQPSLAARRKGSLGAAARPGSCPPWLRHEHCSLLWAPGRVCARACARGALLPACTCARAHTVPKHCHCAQSARAVEACCTGSVFHGQAHTRCRSFLSSRLRCRVLPLD